MVKNNKKDIELKQKQTLKLIANTLATGEKSISLKTRPSSGQILKTSVIRM
jgi:hypothetical protein